MSEPPPTEPEKPKRPFWQLHLLTAVVLVIQMGWLIPLLIEAHRYLADVLIQGSVVGFLVITGNTVALECFLRRTIRKSVQVVGGIVIIMFAGFAAHGGRKLIQVALVNANHRLAARACVDFAEAQERYHDVSQNPKWYDYHFAERMDGSDEESLLGVGMIAPELAQAEAMPGPAIPKHGYLFKILTRQGAHATGGKRNYVVPRRRHGEDAELMTLGYAVVAFPAEYSVTGYKSFIINGNGTIYEKDLGPNTVKLASEMTEFDPDPSWTPVDSGR